MSIHSKFFWSYSVLMLLQQDKSTPEDLPLPVALLIYLYTPAPFLLPLDKICHQRSKMDKTDTKATWN